MPRISFILFTVSLLGTFHVSTRLNGAEEADDLSSLEKEIVQEINLARTSPRKYASLLDDLKHYYDGNLLKRPGKIPLVTQEGVSAVDEALRFLRAADPLPPLRPSRGMSLGANDHVEDTGPKGLIGHQGSDGSETGQRLKRYGSWHKQVGENIAYGVDAARETVMALIIDDGVPERGHRRNIFSPNYRVIGVGCGPHATYHTMCVITFAAEYSETPNQ